MIDTTTQQPLSVTKHGDSRPYIMLPVVQLGEVSAILDAHGVSYWIDEHAISLEGGPETTVIHLARDCDPEIIQRVLDNRM